MAANGYGIMLAAWALCKGYYAPSHPADVKISGEFPPATGMQMCDE